MIDLQGAFVLIRGVILFGLLGVASMLHAQAAPTATRTGDLKIGGGFSTADSDYGLRFNGGAAYFDCDFLPHIGVTGEFHFVKGGDDLYEKTYEVGGRYFRTYGRVVPFAKVLYGRGVFNFAKLPDGFTANLAYNMIAVGGCADFKVKPHLLFLADGQL